MKKYMTVTITYIGGYQVRVFCNDRRFKNMYGDNYRCKKDDLYQLMKELTEWGNKTLGESIIFEIGG